MTYREIAAALKEVEELMIPQDGAMPNLGAMVVCVSPNKGCEVLDGKLTHE